MNTLRVEDIEYIAIHCSATKGDVSAATIRRWHTDKGWTDIGYHFVIRIDGTIELGRCLDKTGAHVKGFNSKSWGICLAGGLDRVGKPENNFTEKQSSSLYALLVTLRHIAPQAHIQGHRDFPGVIKACPCFNVREWLPEVLK